MNKYYEEKILNLSSKIPNINDIELTKDIVLQCNSIVDLETLDKIFDVLFVHNDLNL